MSGHAVSQSVDLDACAREPIHTPGTIQPFGCLIAIRASTGEVFQVSANVESWLGVAAESVLGASISNGSPPPALLDTIVALRAAISGSTEVPIGSKSLWADVHRQEDILLVEFEDPASNHASQISLGDALHHLAMAESEGVLLEAAVESVHQLTGFDRVLAYRFDEDNHGEVIAERVNQGVESYLGLQFPESDIPRQARALYLKNWIRCIPDARYEPVRLLRDGHASQGELDLSAAVLRSVSPVHLEYLRNMGLAASMSVSLIVEGRLWGLISCGHCAAKKMPRQLRTALATIGRMVSLQLSGFRALQLQRQLKTAEGPLQALRDAMLSSTDGLLHGLIGATDLARLLNASGVAILANGSVLRSGDCPTDEQVVQVAGLVAQNAANSVFSTRSLPRQDSRFASLGDKAAGVLAVALPTGESILWFRPEFVHTVNWGGNPHKPATAGDGSRLHPRGSFQLWKQELKGISRPWLESELLAAHELRRSIIELGLVRQVEKERAAVQARDDLVAVVSHDLRTPVSVVAMQAALVQRLLAHDGSDASKRLLASAEVIQRSAERMTALLNNLLDLARIEAGRFEIVPQPRLAANLLRDTYDLVSPLAAAKGISLNLLESPGMLVQADAERIFQVLSNLLGNAIKFTPAGGRIEMGATLAGKGCTFFVRDSGPGLTETQQMHVFDRYWQGKGGTSGGTGLGLYICKGIVEAHGGSIEVESTEGAGALFRFTLPLAAD